MIRLRRSPLLLAALVALALCASVEWAVASQHTHAPEDCGACRLVQLSGTLDVPSPIVAASPVLTVSHRSDISAPEIRTPFSPEAGRAPPLS